MKRIFANPTLIPLMIIMMITTTLVPLLSARGQTQGESPTPLRERGKTLRSYVESRELRGNDDLRVEERRPDWVETAVRLATNRLSGHKEAAGLTDAKSELKLMRADEDDFGLTHVRMNQQHNGVEVYGGQLVAHLRDGSLSNVSGRVFSATDVNTTPAISEAQAVEAARAAFSSSPESAAAAEAKLVVLPHSVFKGEKESGATLTYQVALQVDSSSGPQLYQCFIDANDGRLVWDYNDTQAIEQGWGYSLYSGTVPLRTSFESRPFPQFSVYLLADGATSTYDLNNQFYGTYSQGQLMEDWDNYWGDWTQGNRQSAAADVHFGMTQSRDYFFYRQNGWRGLDNRGNGINAGVHYGTNYSNSFCNGLMLSFGDGGMSSIGNTRPWVSLDIVGHEYTHALIKFTSRLKYEGESGAINESLADIFGTAVEHYAHETYPNNPGLTANYTIAEKIFTSSPDGQLYLRSMENPPLKGQPDYYSNRVYQGFCTPQGDPTKPGFNDSCGVHTNSGIMNKAFWLLAQGGTFRGVTVPRIGRAAAENIFFRAMVYYLTETSNFSDAYLQTSRAAAEVPGMGDFYKDAVSKAWQAVGVFEVTSAPAAVAWAPNRIDIFARGIDGACWTKIWDGSRWSVWLPLGGEIIGAPTVASRGENRLDVFARWTNNWLYQNIWDGTRWSGWQPVDSGPLGRGLASAPAAVSWGANRLDIFVRGTDNQVYQKTLDGGWSGWVSMGGGTYDTPAVSSRGYNRLDLFVRGTNDLLYQRSFNGYSGGWSDWEPLGTPAPNVSLASGPAAVGRGSYKVQVFARGSDTACYGKDFEGFEWYSWYPLGGGMYDAPAVTTWGYDRLDLFVRGTDNHLYQKFQIGSNWSGWTPLP